MPAIHEFRLNSLYDPDITYTGHQPYQYDQIRNMYSYYLVDTCEWEITFTDPSADGVLVGANITINAEGSIASKDYATIAERAHCKLLPLNDTGKQTVKMTGRTNLAELFGLTRTQYATNLTTYAAGTGSNPYQTCTLQVVLIDPNANAVARSVSYTARLTYHGKLYGYMPPAQS